MSDGLSVTLDGKPPGRSGFIHSQFEFGKGRVAAVQGQGGSMGAQLFVLRPSVCLHLVRGCWKGTQGHRKSPIKPLTHILKVTHSTKPTATL